MIKQFEFKNINKDGDGKTGRLFGKLRKIVVKLPKVMPEVRLEVFTNDGEKVFEGNMKEEVNVFYPFNIVERVGNDQVETQPFFVSGHLEFLLIGLSDERADFVSSLKFVYEE